MVKAAVCRAFGKALQIEDIAVAEPGPGEVRAKVSACAICHSDILYAEGAWGGELPAVYGHEAAGVVEAVGPGVSHVAPGDPAVITLVRACGRCPCCNQGFYGSCETRFALDEGSPLADGSGAPLVHGLRTGAFAEAVLVEASQVVAIPEEVPLESAALLACGVITGLGAVINTAKVRAGADVVVIGTGGVGLNAVQGARLAGAGRIIAVDLSDDKLDAAEAFGATHGVNPGKQDLAGEIGTLTGGRGADYVFVTVGAKAAVDGAYDLLAAGGALVLVGMPALGETSAFDIVTLANDSKRILGSKMGSSNVHEDIPRLIGLYQQGRLKLDELITARYPLSEINEAIASTKRGEALRNVIVF